MIGRTNAGGSGGGLNFTVKAYSILPASGKENEIAVITTTPMTGYVLQAEQPIEPYAGLVWIKVSTQSGVAFYADKKQTIKLYPISAKQFDGNTWIVVPAQSYRNGAWSSWWDGELYDNGNEYTEITGGWVKRSWLYSPTYTTNSTVTKNASDIMLTVTSTDKQCGIVLTSNDIDLTNYSTLTCEISNISGNTDDATFAFAVVDRSAQYFNDGAVAKKATTAAGTLTLNISSITGRYAICLYIITWDSGTFSMRLKQARLS